MRRLLILGFVLPLILSALPAAADRPPASTSDPFASDNSSNSVTQEQVFLPVEEAYQVQVDVDGEALRLLWSIAPGYYLYKDRFKFEASANGQPLTLTPHFETGKVKYDEYFEKELEVFYHGTQVDAALPTGAIAFDLTVTSQGCADAGLCYPPHKHYFRVDTQTGLATPRQPPSHSSAAGQTPAGDGGQSALLPATGMPATTFSLFALAVAMLAAVLGGAILNLMPCVFPVLSIKALSLAGASHGPHHQHLHGWTYTAGVVGAFLAVASAMLAARAGGQAVGWGFQLQSPIFVSFLAYLFFTMGLSLSGLIDFGTRLMGVGQSLTGGRGLRASFFTGVLAAVVASPCTAPMMGFALGYALTQPAAVALCVFAALGFGMALPFLLLSYLPRLARRLPAPGAWMETLKQCMAFPMYLTAIWLLWILGHQVNSDAVALLSIGAVLIAFALWLLRLPFASRAGRSARAVLAGAAIVGAATIPFSAQKPRQDHWEAYTDSRLAQLREAGEPVFVNLTADWCITCLANEKIALDTEKVNTALAISGIHTLKGDWTNYNPEITALLNRYGRNGVPLYLLFPAQKDAKAEILPQLLTEDIVLQAIARTVPSQTALN